MKLIEFKNMNVPLLEWWDMDAVWAVREKLFETLWPLSHGQLREVMEEFYALHFQGSFSWVVGAIIEVDKVSKNIVAIRSVSVGSYGTNSYSVGYSVGLYGKCVEAWKYDVLSKTRPITSPNV